MKRMSTKILALVLTLSVGLGLLTGCDLISVNVDKDVMQVVANVNVEGKFADSGKIYKRELMSGYVNYGYYYVLYYDYDAAQAYELVLNNLINNKVILQYARTELDAAAADADDEYEKHTSTAIKLGLPDAKDIKDKTDREYIQTRTEYVSQLVAYLDDVDIAQAVYNVKSNINSIIDSFDDEETDPEDEKEDETFEARTAPTVETKDGEAVDEEYVKYKNEAESKGWDEDITVEELEKLDGEIAAYDAWRIAKYESYQIKADGRHAAVKDFLDSFAENGIIGTKEFANLGSKQYDVSNYSYYADQLVSNLENAVISVYEDRIEDEAEGGMTPESLYNDYIATFNSQKAAYSTDLTAYETALDGVTEDSYILYNPALAGGKQYGYVANILIGFSDEQSAALTAYGSKVTDRAKIKEYRAELLKGLVVTDQRESWLKNTYFDTDDIDVNAIPSPLAFGKDYVRTAGLEKFVGTYGVTGSATTDTENGYYHDENGWAWGDKDVENKTFRFTDVVAQEIPFETFLTGSEEYSFATVLGTTPAPVTDKVYSWEGKIGAYTEADDILTDEDMHKVEDLIYAFNTDPGALGNYLGYLLSPVSNNFVKEFADAAEYVIGQGVGSYCVVATDYGYHIIVCTKVVKPNTEPAYTDAAAFEADLETEKTVAYRFKKAKVDAGVQDLVNDIVNFRISKYLEDGEKQAVTRYPDAYKNLIPETEEDA